jgi:hypothetical protein
MIPEHLPPETVVKGKAMHTLMVQHGGVFVSSIQVPLGTTIAYGFLSTTNQAGIPKQMWDDNGGRGFYTIAVQDRIIEEKSPLPHAQARALPAERPGKLFWLLGIGVIVGCGLLFRRRSRRFIRRAFRRVL